MARPAALSLGKFYEKLEASTFVSQPLHVYI